MTSIKFGTDGWRAIVGKDFSEENVRLVTNAIGKYVFEKYGIGRAAWSYKEMDFGLIDEHMDPVREEVIREL